MHLLRFLPRTSFGVPLHAVVQLVLLFNAVNKASGLYGLLSIFTAHPVDGIQWTYYLTNTALFILTVSTYIYIIKLPSSNLNNDASLPALKCIAVFTICYVADFLSGNLFMLYLANLWIKEENQGAASIQNSTSVYVSHLVKRVSKETKLQSASEQYEIGVSVITILISELIRGYFVSLVLSYYLRLRRRVQRRLHGWFARPVDVLDKLL